MHTNNERDNDDYETETVWEDNNTGGKRQVTYRGDGSSTEHHGGPVGDVHREAQTGMGW